MLGNRLPERLAFKPGIDWTSGLAASLRGQIDFLMGEIKRQGGVADNRVALASLTDLMVSLVLRGIPHNYLERLGSGRFGAVPAYVRRADDFMRAYAAVPIRMEQVAAAAVVASGHSMRCSASSATPRRSRRFIRSGSNRYVTS
jgi:hypothetical protein